MNPYLQRLKKQQRKTENLLKQLRESRFPEPILVKYWEKELEILSREIEIEEGGNDPSN